MPQDSQGGLESAPDRLPTGRLGAWAWAPVPAFILAMAVLWLADLRTPHEAPHLLVVLNFTFSTAISFFVAYLAAISFLASGMPSILLLGSGVLVMGTSFLVAAVSGQGAPNVTATVHNTGMFAAALLLLASAVLSRRPGRPVREAAVVLGAAYLGALAFVLLTAYLALQNLTPPFFVQGRGGTPVRQFALAAAAGMFAVSSLALSLGPLGDRFRRWYAPGLALLGVGLVGVMLQPSLGSPISWMGRFAQYLGGVYLLGATIAAARHTRRWGLPLEAALQEAEARYGQAAERERFLKAILDTAQDGFWVVDGGGRLIDVNPAYCAMSGYSREELLRMRISDLESEESLEETASHIRRIREKGFDRFEARHRRKDGSPLRVAASVTFIGQERGLMVCFLQDITERKRLEVEREKLGEQFRMSQKMEGIGRLAGGIAHDFNNILTVILSSAGFALEGLKDGDPLREDVLEIEKAGKRAASLTRQLLAFSRKQMLQPVPLDLNWAIVELEKMLRRIIGEDVAVELILAPDLGLVMADPGQVEQVIVNLAINARDAMPKGGKLTIETANVDLDAAYAAMHDGVVPGPHVLVRVADSGTGMDEPTRARIFEPFFTTKGPGKGSGLGLSTVYGIVAQSAGSIVVESEPGQGTTFKVYLPREASLAMPTVTAPRAVMQIGGSETILVVEDEESVRHLAKRILSRGGYTVLAAANGAEALLLCEKHPGEIHLALTDVVMPEMGGAVFAERLAKVRPGTQIVFMSGYTDDAIGHHGVLDPGIQFIGKPFARDELLRKVRGALDRGSKA